MMLLLRKAFWYSIVLLDTAFWYNIVLLLLFGYYYYYVCWVCHGLRVCTCVCCGARHPHMTQGIHPTILPPILPPILPTILPTILPPILPPFLPTIIPSILSRILWGSHAGVICSQGQSFAAVLATLT